jgi:arylformamidase
VGIDSLNIDDIADMSRPAHTILLGAAVPVCEHMTNLASVESAAGRLHAVPIAWVGGATFPYARTGRRPVAATRRARHGCTVAPQL